MDFQDFCPETIDFLWGIRFNNNREWFQAHKQDYETYLYRPMKALAAAVSAEFDGEDGSKLHLSRIYRDMRMHPSTFYKDSLWFCLRRPGDTWLEQPGLCFEIRPEGYRYGFLLARPKAAQMEAFRLRISDHSAKFLQLVNDAQRESGLILDGDRYARPKPCENAALQPYFSLKNLLALADCPPDERLYSPELAQELKRVFHAWKLVYDFCQNL